MARQNKLEHLSLARYSAWWTIWK